MSWWRRKTEDAGTLTYTSVEPNRIETLTAEVNDLRRELSGVRSDLDAHQWREKDAHKFHTIRFSGGHMDGRRERLHVTTLPETIERWAPRIPRDGWYCEPQYAIYTHSGQHPNGGALYVLTGTGYGHRLAVSS